MDKFSYALGLSIGQSLMGSGLSTLQYEDFVKGVKDILTGVEPKLSIDEGNKILDDTFAKINAKKEAEIKEIRKKNLEKANAYMKANKSADGVITTDSGLQYKVISSVKSDETRRTPGHHDRVKVHYEGRLIDGSVFDSSYKRGEPITISLDQVIPGWAEGLHLMSVGDKYEFTIPPQLGYGEVGVQGVIPGNTVLIFTVELFDIE